MFEIKRTFFWILTFFLFFLLACILTYPAIFHLSDKLIGDGGDNYQNLIFQFIANQKIKLWQWPFSYTNILRYPVGFNFGKGFESVIVILTGAFFSLFFNSVLAYNITFLLLLSLNGLFSFLLFRYLSKSCFLGTIGGIIYGYSFYVIARSAGHLNLFFIAGFPFFVYALLRIKDKFIIKNVTFVFTAATLIFLGSLLNSLIFILSLFLVLPCLILFFPKTTFSILDNAVKKAPKILAILLPFLLIVIIFGGQHFYAFLTGDYYKPDRSDFLNLLHTSPSLKDYILPNSYLPLRITELAKSLNNSFRSIDRVVFIGWVELFLFILFAFFYKNKRLKNFILLLTFIFFVLSLGYINPETHFHMPFYLLHQMFPFSFMDEPSRFFTVFYFFLTMGIVLFLNQIRGVRKRLVLFTLIIFLAVIERLPFKFWLADVFVKAPYVQVVNKEKSAAVLDIPVSYVNSVYDILPYAYQKKVVSGYFQWFADTEKPKSFIRNNSLTRFICGEPASLNKKTFLENKKLAQTLKTYDIRTIVVHKNDPDDYAKYYFPECANARIQTSILLPQLFTPFPTDKQEVLSLFFPAVSGLGETVKFNADGVFYIDGFHVFPNDWLPLEITIDNSEVRILNKGWVDKGGRNSTNDPFLEIPVKKGSEIKFNFSKNHNTDYSFIKLWYRYQVAGVGRSGYINEYGIEKIYEDDEAAIFRIN